MTGRDLIIYILTNNLENEPVFKDGKFVGLMSIEDAAVKFGVGVETVRALCMMGRIKGIILGDTIYIPCNCKLDEGSKSKNE